ncbi:2-hydroxychromene-2-carboxylate isomerase [Chitinivorax tropicus]|uniref:2-hydroxychromene-2-carboxylate isomerase n=1 Tax=Chitinivorax tropicus TaxID=714531 RepID=A0A840MPZ0_9PROT|nr:2-hydroxychromene-2-carboxylate isomerase [Chitinivorax tropicus]MBB5019117.1 2-hydroxychromene-2-carboxylate isomerase [Chitinivorax tropicus]
MSLAIDFYFDFSSPYSYIAANRLDGFDARNGKTLVWRPILTGAIFKLLNNPPQNEPKLAYMMQDAKRCAAYHRMPLNWPSHFPINPLAACRAFYWLYEDKPDVAVQIALALLKAYWVTDHDISDGDYVLDLGERFGIDREYLHEGLNDQNVKDKLRQTTEVAFQRGVFGVPWVFVGDEPFWGQDRLDQMERWVQIGGWKY